MIHELKAFKHQLSNSSISKHFSELFFSDIDHQETEIFLSNIIQRNISRYSEIPEIKKKITGPTDIDSQLKTLLSLFPSFFFTVCQDLDKNPKFSNSTRFLRLAIISSITSKNNRTPFNTSLFLKNINPETTLEDLEIRLSNQISDPTYIPKIIFQDFALITENAPLFPISKKPQDLIEILYYFNGITQIHLKYFFNLICETKNDHIAQHINTIFSKVLFGIKKQDTADWKNYKGGLKTKIQLQSSIRKDSEKSRHPNLREHVFESLKSFHPIIQDGSTKDNTASVRKLLMKQLADFHALPINRLILLLDIVQKCNGKNYIKYLLTQMFRSDNEKLFELASTLQRSNNKTTEDLAQLTAIFVKNIPRKEKSTHLQSVGQAGMETVYKTADSLRKVTAKRQVRKDKGKSKLTPDQVPKFLKMRLTKLYERVKKEGALTQDMIPEYLSKFVDSAELLIGPVPVGGQQMAIGEFKTTADEILQEISGRGHLSSREITEYQTEIDEQTEKLVTTDIEERTEVVDDIGVTLTDASSESDKRKEANERNAFLKKDLIPYGLDKKAQRISVSEFFSFPFGDYNGPNEEDWFNYHIRYLKMAVKKNKLGKSIFVKIFNTMQYIPKLKYKKYFNIFPNDKFEETTFMAVYDLWKNRAFEKLRILS